MRRYGWSAKLNISIITDFEEFAVYDCSIKPQPTDKASVARIKYLTYNDYEKEWNFIWDTFSKEAVLKGFFDKYLSGTKEKRGTTSVDKEFLQSLDNWRTLLAENIYRENKQLTEDELNYIVQATLDRLIFLRIAEDRSIEVYGRLQGTLSNGEYFKNLLTVFIEADQKYNSGLFDFKKDTISENLKLNNKTLKTIINQLYYPESPYEFSVLSVEILGSAYEQFLGKVIQINNRGKAVIEFKPEVRKAGGVFYTPQYIVEYIVKSTVGKLCENKTPEQVENIKILDPACGSGSFLIGAYQYLLDWHKDYYIKNPKKKNPLTPDGNLTTSEKKRILLNNIFGVDLDINAVEVTKLSLLLKSLEGETQASVSHQLAMFHERVLPTLDKNIKDGNSLISTDYYDTNIDFGEEKKIKPFNWKKFFPSVFAKNGFDVIIGNPPYVRIQNLQKEVLTYFERYQTAKGNYDIYCLFVEKGIELLNDNGLLSYILPHRFFKTDYGIGLRSFLTKNDNLYKIVDFDGFYVFENASINTCIIHTSKQSISNSIEYYRIKNHKIDAQDLHFSLQDLSITNKDIESGIVSKKNLTSDYWNFIFDKENQLYNKLNINSKLADFGVKIIVGLQTSADPVFITKLIQETDEYFEVISKETKKTYQLEKEIMFPLLRGAEVKKYKYPKYTDLLIFPYKIIDDKAILIETNNIKNKYPKIWEYLSECKDRLMERDKGKLTYPWYAFGRSQNLTSFSKNKIMTTVLSGHNSFTLDMEGRFYFVGGGNAGVYGIQVADEHFYPYLLGLLNSRLLTWYHSKISLRCYQTAFSYGKRFIEQLPIKSIDFSNNSEKDLFEKIDSSVKQLLQLNKEIESINLPNLKEQISAKIEYFEDKINEYVYKLYNVSIEEINLIENR